MQCTRIKVVRNHLNKILATGKCLQNILTILMMDNLLHPVITVVTLIVKEHAQHMVDDAPNVIE